MVHLASQTRDPARGGVQLEHTLADAAANLGLGDAQSALGGLVIATGQRLLNLFDVCANPAGPRTVDRGPLGCLTDALLGRTMMRHRGPSTPGASRDATGDARGPGPATTPRRRPTTGSAMAESRGSLLDEGLHAFPAVIGRESRVEQASLGADA